MMSSEIEVAPPPPPPTSPQHEQADDDDIYGPVTKAASREAKRDERRKEEELQHAQSPLTVREKMNIETAQVLAAAAAASPQQQYNQKKQRQPNNNTKQLIPPSTSPRGKMSVAARSLAAADFKNNDNNNNNQKDTNNATIEKPPSSGNRGIARGKYSAAEAKRLADAWGRDDTSEEEGYFDYYDDDGSSYYDEEEGDEEPSYYNNDNPTEEEMFHYQHHRVSAYSNRYGRGHGRSSTPGNHDGNKTNLHSNNKNDGNKNQAGGIFSIATNWLQNQREKLHQLELERKVEEQRRKLVEEGRKQRELEAEKRRDRGYAISPPSSPSKHSSAVASSAIAGDEVATSSLVYMNGCVCSSQEEESQVLETVNSSGSNGLYICGFGGNYALPLDDASDYSGVARIDSAGNIVEMMPSSDGLDDSDNDEDDEQGDYMTVRTPKITRTGKGMSVEVDIPKDNRSDSSDPRHVDVKIVPEPRRDENSDSFAPFILLPPQMKALLESGALPQSLNYCKWKRLYSLSRDGDSFETFLRMVEGHNRTVLVVKTTAGRLFGGYADTRWEARHKNRQADGFYGSAQACLFRFPRCGETNTSDASSSEVDNEVVIYKWTGANRYIQLCDASKRAVAFGGGGDDGDFGLCIEDDFRRGTTGHCSTFENDSLCEEGYFDVVDLEVWGFTLDF
ncbi:hypothetical protein ACHAWT_008219 [Skeletonema menzelii]